MNNFFTFADAAKRMNPDESMAEIIESMNESNPVMQHIPFVPGTSITGRTSTRRTKIPEPEYRRINRGVGNDKSDVRQVNDTLCKLELRSVVDVELLKLQANSQAFRTSEDAAMAEGFGQKMARLIFYGDQQSNPDEFDGFDVRYHKTSTTKHTEGYQIVDGGGTTAKKLTTAWFIGWGPKAVTGFYPKNGTAGLQVRDLGEADELDSNGKKFRAVTTLMQWSAGLSVDDVEYVSALRNIDTSTIKDLDAAGKLTLVEKLTYAKNRLKNLSSGNRQFRMYVSDVIYDFLEVYLLDKNNITVTQQTIEGARAPQTYFRGIPVYRMDCLSNTESKIS